MFGCSGEINEHDVRHSLRLLERSDEVGGCLY